MLKQMLNEQAINIIPLSEFLESRFPGAKTSNGSRHLLEVALLLDRWGYDDELALDELLRRAEAARNAMDRETPIPTAAGHIARAIGLEEPGCREESRWKQSTRFLLYKYATVR
jgi:hypothetical protein